MKKKKVTQAPPVDPTVYAKKRKILTVALLLLCLALYSCQPGSAHHTPAQPSLAPVLVIHMNDYSLSEPESFFDGPAADQLYNTLAGLPCSSVIKHIGIYAESGSQDILTMSVQRPDTVSTAEIKNVYQLAKAKARNLKALAAYQQQAEADLARYTAEISKPHEEQHTDLFHAFYSLAATTVATPNFSGFSKYLLVSSDLKDSPAPGQPHMVPVQLSGTTVLLIRPALSLDSAKALFPGSSVYIFTTAEDAISFISHNQKQ